MQKQIFYKDSSNEVPNGVDKTLWDSLAYGAEIESNLNLKSLATYIFSGSDSYESDKYRKLHSLKNIINENSTIDDIFIFDNLKNKPISLNCIYSIHLGSGIEPGTVVATVYDSGSIASYAKDTYRNGVLYDKEGESVGFVLYKQGFIAFNSEKNIINSNNIAYVSKDTDTAEPLDSYKWCHFLSRCQNAIDCTLTYNSINETPTNLTFIYAEKGELNHSNNPTYIKNGSYKSFSDSYMFIENKPEEDSAAHKLEIKNTTQSPFNGANAAFDKQTFITNIGLYSDDKKLIAIANLSNPIRKTENREFVFKLKIDL